MPVPVKTTTQWEEFGKEYTAKGIGRMHDKVAVKGRGLKLTMHDGEEYLDFTAGIGVTNLGHCHPVVNAAVIEQLGNIVHAQSSIMMSLPYLQLIERLLPVMPHPSLDLLYFWNSGAEAIEAAIKLARHATERPYVITFQGAYHGRTAGAGALTRSKPSYMKKMGPFMPGVYVSAYPYWHSLGLPQSTPEDEIVKAAKHHLDMLFKQQVSPAEVAAIFIEPVQGEGGYVPCPHEFLLYLREKCDEYGILLVIDEVQTGFFRTGKYFAVNHIPGGFRPDIMAFAKGVANGFPISGIATRKELSEKMLPGSLGGTYAGNPVACAAAIAVQEVLATGEVEENVGARSQQILSSLRNLQSDAKTSHLIADVRGVGLMVAVEFRNGQDALTLEKVTPNVTIPENIGKRVVQKCFENKLLLLTTSCFDTIRFIPALIVSEEEMAQAMTIFSNALREVAQEG